jgi:hypothetical protein
MVRGGTGIGFAFLGLAFFDFPRFDFPRFDFLGDEARLEDFFRPRVDFFRDMANTPNRCFIIARQ